MAAAFFAAHEPAQQVPGTPTLPKPGGPSFGNAAARSDGTLASLDGLPQFIIHKAESGYLLDDPFLGSIMSRPKPTGFGVLEIGEAVPNQSTDIELVVQNARATAKMAANSRVPPFGVSAATPAFANWWIVRSSDETCLVVDIEPIGSEKGITKIGRDSYPTAEEAEADVKRLCKSEGTDGKRPIKCEARPSNGEKRSGPLARRLGLF
jgi:hypothetical protein